MTAVRRALALLAVPWFLWSAGLGEPERLARFETLPACMKAAGEYAKTMKVLARSDADIVRGPDSIAVAGARSGSVYAHFRCSPITPR